MSSSSGLEISWIKTFGMHLEQALHDVEHEQSSSGTVVHFWDDDSLFIPAFGFLLIENESTTSEDQLTQALFSGGEIDGITMLPPHRAEFLANIARFTEREQSRANGSYGQRLEAFFARHDKAVGNFEAAARKIHDELCNQATVDDLILSLSEVDEHAYILAESANGTWQQRVKSILSRLQTMQDTDSMPSTEEVLANPYFSRLCDGIAAARKETPVRLASIADAAALTMLLILKDSANDALSERFPRYFTSSPTLQRLYNSKKWFRDLFRFTIERSGNRTGTVWRDAYYYQLRVYFESLKMGRLAPTPKGPSLESLKDLNDRIILATRAGDSDLRKLLNSQPLDGETDLVTVLQRLDGRGMARPWLSFQAKGHMGQWLLGISDVLSLGDLEGSKEAAAQLVADLTEQLKIDVTVYDLRFKLTDAVRRILFHESHSPVANPEGHVRFVDGRWGVSTQELENLDILSNAESNEKRLLRVADLASPDVELVVQDALLALLLEYKEFKLVRSLLRNRPNLEIGSKRASVMGMAAEVACGDLLPGDRYSEIASALTSFVNELSDEEHRALCLVVGLIYFFCWRGTWEGIGVGGIRSDQHGWARESCDSVNRWLPTFEGELRVWAINHIVYVDGEAALKVQGFRGLRRELRSYVDRAQRYEFWDTLGWLTYLEASRDRLYNTDKRVWAEKWLPRLERAEEDLRQALELGPAHGEIRAHVMDVQELTEEARNAMT